MGWAEYRVLCDRPDYWSRWMIEQTIELLDELDRQALIEPLSRALKDRPLEKPDDHKGGAGLDMHHLECGLPTRRAIASAMVDAKRLGLTTSGTRGRGLGGFAEAWREYAVFPD